MSNVTHIIPRKFGKVADLRKQYPDHIAKADGKRCVVLMIPRKAANQEYPAAA